jgi:ADP-glucose pyrophosphorylase
MPVLTRYISATLTTMYIYRHRTVATHTLHAEPEFLKCMSTMTGPTTYDNDITDIIAFYDASIDTVHFSNFDDHVYYRHCTVATHTLHAEPEFLNCMSTMTN